MTNSSPVRFPTFVSPFLLPYIQADREDLDKLARTAIEEHSPNGTVMLSPMEEHPGRESFVSSRTDIYRTAPVSPQRPTHARASLTPQSKLTADSPNATRRSMIERSINELTFDPDLTFMDSPDRRSAVSDQSPSRDAGADAFGQALPSFSSPMKTVSPDRTVVPLDESEIGFSNELRASMKILPQAPPEETIASSLGNGKRRRLAATTSEIAAHVAPIEDIVEKSPTKSSRSKRTTNKAATVVQEAKLKAAEVSQSTSQPKMVSASSRKRKTNDEGQGKNNQKTSSSESIPISKPISKARSTASESISRKSPRFASKVITAKSVVPPLMLCPSCKKAYKRTRDYDKHVASCK